jgi:dephospho-CoA kinase
MKLFGLTGGIGTGKSTAASILARRGVRMIDTDDLAREMVVPGQPALQEIAAAFGPAMIDAEGRLDRANLAAIVFADAAKRNQLEAILHPRIRSAWKDRVAAWRSEGVPVGVVVIPLLFETGAQGEFDLIICTACPEATQLGRLAARGWSPAQSAARLAAQWPLDRKMAASHRVIWTEGDLEVHERQIGRVLGLFVS